MDTDQLDPQDLIAQFKKHSQAMGLGGGSQEQPQQPAQPQPGPQPGASDLVAQFNKNSSNPQNRSPAYQLADKLTDHSYNETYAIAAAGGVPKENREEFLESLHDLASKKKTSENRSFLTRGPINLFNSAIGLGESALQATGVTGESEEDKSFERHVKSVWQNADPISNPKASWYNPGEAVVKAMGAAPSLEAAGIAGEAASGGAKALGAGEGLVAFAGKLGSAGSFAPEMYQSTYDDLLGKGVAPSTAKWSAATSAGIQSALMLGLPESLRNEGKSAFKSLPYQIALKYGATAALHGPTVMSGQKAVNEAIEDMAQDKSPEFKKFVSHFNVAGEFGQNAMLSGALAAPGALSEAAAPEAKQITTKQIKQDRIAQEIAQAAKDDVVPTRKQFKSWGLSGGKSGADRYAAVQDYASKVNQQNAQGQAPTPPNEPGQQAEGVPEEYPITKDFVDGLKSESVKLKQPTGEKLETLYPAEGDKPAVQGELLGTVNGKKVYAVDGRQVNRAMPDGENKGDFVGGGNRPWWNELFKNDKGPKEDELWVGNNLPPGEIQAWAYHEAIEEHAMSKLGLDYETAHSKIANPTEQAWAHESPGGDVRMNPPAGDVSKPSDVTSIRNQVVDDLRAERGKEPIAGTKPEKFEDWLSQAADTIKQDPTYPDRLVEEIIKNPRVTDEKETAALQIQYRGLENSYREASEKLFDAAKEGRSDDAVRAQYEVDQIDKKMDQAEEAYSLSGTKAGRALVARRIELKRDFSLAGMVRRAKVANLGKDIAPEDTAKFKEMSDNIASLQEQLKKYESGKELPKDIKKSFAKTTERRDKAAKSLSDAWDDFKKTISGQPTENVIKGESGALNVDIVASGYKLAKAAAKYGIATVGDFLENAKGMLGEEFDKHKDALTEAWNRYKDDELAERVEKTSKNLDKSIAKLEEELQSGKIEKKAKPEKVTTPEIEEKRSRLEELKKQKKDLIDSSKPSPEERDQESYRKGLRKRLQDWQLRNEQFEETGQPPEKKVPKDRSNDKVAKDIKDKIEIEKLKSKVLTEKFKRDNRSRYEYAMDLASDIRVFNALSYSWTAVKMIEATAWKAALLPINEATGGILGLIPGVSDVAEKSPIEAGMSFSAVGKAYVSMITKGIPAAIERLRTGSNQLERLYGKPSARGRSILTLPREIHGALKDPLKNMNFEYAMYKQRAFYGKKGVDISDSGVQMMMEANAYKFANKEIFMQDNKVASGIANYIESLGKTAETAGKLLFPVRTVPTNIIAEAFDHIVGAEIGAKQVREAFKQGIESLDENKADAIIRHLKHGLVGNAILALGFFCPQIFGGFHQTGEHRREDEPEADGMKLFGVKINKKWLHTPLFYVAQAGATFFRAATATISKKDTNQKGWGMGLLAGGMGLVEAVPFFGGLKDIEELGNSREAGNFLGKTASDIITPGFVQETAKLFDRDSQGKTIPREPKNAKEWLESGIPGLRGFIKRKQPKHE